MLGPLALLGVLSCVHSELRSPAQGGPEWTLIETENFRLFSDLDPQDAELIAKQLESDLKAISQAAFKSVHPVVDDTDVILFSHSAHFHKFATADFGGYFYRHVPFTSETRHTVVTYGDLDEATRTTLMHELTHDLFARNFGPAPAWLNEGWAQYYSTVRVEAGQLRVGGALPSLTFTDEARPFVASHNGQMLVAMPASMVAPPSVLTRMSSEDFYHVSRRANSTPDEVIEQSGRYLGAWGFLHMLIDSKGLYSDRFNSFLADVRTASVDDAWTRAFQGIDRERLDRDFRAYLLRRELSVFIVPASNKDEAKILRRRKLSDGEVHALWARLRLASPSLSPADRLTQATQELDAALQSEPRLAEAFYYLGVIALHENRFDQAAIHFERATSLAPEESRFLSAQLRLELTKRGDRLENEEALSLRPKMEHLAEIGDSASALLLAAHYFLALGARERALALGQRALERSPVDPHILHSYALLLEGANQIGEAIAHERLAVAFLTEDQNGRAEMLTELRRMEARAASPSASH